MEALLFQIALSIVAVALVSFVWWTSLPKPYSLSLPATVAARAASLSLPRYALGDGGGVLVTGGAGFLGRHIVDALLAQGTRVVVFDLASGYVAPPGVTFVRGNLVSRAEVEAALRAHAVRLVFHVASPDPNSTNTALFRAVNVEGTANVIAACRAAGVRALVYTSSASVVWAGAPQEGVDEAAPYPAAFRDPYAATKAEAERLVMAAGAESARAAAAAGGSAAGLLATVSLRPHAIFGPRDPTMLPTVVAMAKAGRQRFIVGDGSNVVDWTYVGNVVHAHLLAAEVALRDGAAAAACGRTYFITNGAPLRFWEFMNAILLGLGYAPSTRRLPYALILGIAYAAQAALAAINACRRTRATMTLSPPRIMIAGTAHHYSIAAAARDLRYAPVWDMDAALYLTLRAFAHLRNARPGAAALHNARRGGLVALKLVDDPDAAAAAKPAAAAAAAAAAKPAAALRGGTQAALAESELPEYTRAEVARHASRGDLWTVIDGRVYDLTSYVEPHPGGDGILNNAGGDSTLGFRENPAHPAHVFETVKQFQIGRLRADA